jgi:integrase
MATIKRRKNQDSTTSYIAQVRRRGFLPMSRSFPSKTAAKIWTESTEKKIDAGTLGASEHMTFNALLEVVEPRLGKSTYQAALEYWRESLGTLRLARITPALIDQHRDNLLAAPCSSFKHKTQRPRKAQTVWHYVQQLSRVFSVGIKELHIISENPIEQVERPSLPKGRSRFLSDDEITALLDACKESDSKSLYAFVLLLLTTGCRSGEAYAMEWSNIDVERRWVTLPKTKNGTARGIPLTQSALDTLMALPRDPSGLVFPSELTKAFNSARTRAKISKFRMHDLRHTAASLLVRAGNSLIEVGRLLGHQDQRMTNRYSHIAQEGTATMVDKVMGGIK